MGSKFLGLGRLFLGIRIRVGVNLVGDVFVQGWIPAGRQCKVGNGCGNSFNDRNPIDFLFEDVEIAVSFSFSSRTSHMPSALERKIMTVMTLSSPRTIPLSPIMTGACIMSHPLAQMKRCRWL